MIKGGFNVSDESSEARSAKTTAAKTSFHFKAVILPFYPAACD